MRQLAALGRGCYLPAVVSIIMLASPRIATFVGGRILGFIGASWFCARYSAKKWPALPQERARFASPPGDRVGEVSPAGNAAVSLDGRSGNLRMLVLRERPV